MKTILKFFILCVFPLIGYGQNPDSKKYINHQSYTEFIGFLKDSTLKIGSDIDRLVFIRKQTAEIIDIGAGGKDASLLSDQWTNFDGKTYYDFFYNNTATVKCGGTSFFLKNIYNDLGYESLTYDMGCPGLYTHQVTLVKCKDNGEYYVQDAFHNVSYYDKRTKQYIPLKHMISLLKAKQDKKIKIVYETYETELSWDTTGLQKILSSRGIPAKAIPSESLFAKQNKKKLVQTSQKMFSRKKNCLEDNEYPEKSIYLFLVPSEYSEPEVKMLFKGS